MNRIFNEHVRLNQKEYDALLHLSVKMRCTKSEVFRTLLHTSILYAAPPIEYTEMLSELRRIGVNLNQIACSLNEKHIVNTEDLKDALNDLYSAEHKLNEACDAKREAVFWWR